MELRYLEDFRPGDRVETDPVTVTAEMIQTFARDYDPQPFHLDPEAAKDSFFKGHVASGWHTAALTMGMVARSGLNVANGLIGLGVDSLRWPTVVRPGDTLRVVVEVLEVKPSRSHPGWGVVKVSWRTVNQDRDTVQEATTNCWVQARPA